MKKKNLILTIIFLITISSIMFYRSYTKSKVQDYLNSFSRNPEILTKTGLIGDIKLYRIVKKSPKEVIMIVKWGGDEVYISIENWLTKAHDKIQISAFDKSKGIKIFE